MGRVLSERRTIGGTVKDYETDAYNLDGSPATVTTLGYSVSYTYSAAERPLTATNYSGGTTKFVSGATYAPPGELAGATLGSATGFAGFTLSNSYNPRLQPILLSASSPSATVFSDSFNFHLGAGDNGNVYQIVNNRDSTHARDQNFVYDSLNRIASGYSSGTQWGETFTIDGWSNLTNRTGISGKTNYEPLNCPANTNNQLTTCSYGYDAAGNMTSNSSASYVYDAENRLIATAGYSYIYDGDGKRVEKCTEGTTAGTCASGAIGTLYWRGASSDALSETDLSGNVQNTYVFFNGRRVARRDSVGAVHYYFSDHLGSHGVVENATGSTCEQDIDYYPYGAVENDYCPTVAQNYKFTGKERDMESGLDYFGARHDASNVGRFMTPDPLMASAKVWDPQTWNRYAYVLNNPLRYVDPDGMNEVTAAQCAKDSKCVTVNVNVIYDKNANAGKGLTSDQKTAFEKGQLQNAKDQYGNADIHLNVTYTAGAVSSANGQTYVSGLQAGALNVAVTDQVGGASSGMAGKMAVSFINVNSANNEDLPHEIAHQFMGDTQGIMNWISARDPSHISGEIFNAISDVANDAERAWMRNLDSHSGAFSHYPLASAFHHNAATFQKSIQPTTQPQ